MNPRRGTIAVLLVLACAAHGANAQNLLDPSWRFQLGDDPAWGAPEVDDAAWAVVEAGTLWEEQGFDAYDGFAWYRTTVTVPSSLEEKAAKYGGFVLRLAKIDDADETFFNGTLIGATGRMPPEYEGAHDVVREYAIPEDQIRWDQENVIAVRVYDAGGGGGIYDAVPELSVLGLIDLIQVRVDLEAPDHVYRAPGPVSIPVVVENGSDEALRGSVRVTLETDFRQGVFAGESAVEVAPGAAETVRLTVPHLAPGFYLGSAVVASDLNNKTHKFAIGVAPEQVLSPAEPPEDFADYWRRAKAELAAIESQFKMTEVEECTTPARKCFLVEMRSLGNVRIRGWYARPVAEGTYPAILHVQGYSSTVDPSWLEGDGNDFVSFGLNVRGHGNSQDNLSPGFPGYLLEQLHDREMYIYRGAYMDCVRAVDFLFSRSEVDKERVVVEGGSQGGALSFAAAALDNQRIRLAVPHVPFLSDFRDYFAIAAWPAGEFEAYVAEHPEVGWERVFDTLAYIDIRNLAPWVKAPVLMGVGLMDSTCPPHINFAAYNNLTVPRDYRVYPYAGHSIPDEFHREKMKWIRARLGME